MASTKAMSTKAACTKIRDVSCAETKRFAVALAYVPKEFSTRGLHQIKGYGDTIPANSYLLITRFFSKRPYTTFQVLPTTTSTRLTRLLVGNHFSPLYGELILSLENRVFVYQTGSSIYQFVRDDLASKEHLSKEIIQTSMTMLEHAVILYAESLNGNALALASSFERFLKLKALAMQPGTIWEGMAATKRALTVAQRIFEPGEVK